MENVINKEEIMKLWEKDWDEEEIYYMVSENGMVRIVNIETGEISEWKI